MAAKEQEDFDPSKSNTAWLVMGHIGEKGVQAGGVLGLCLAVPAAAILQRRGGGTLDASFLPKAERTLLNTTAATTAFSLLAGVGLLGLKEGWDKEKLEDRAYRLHYSESQNRTDRFSRTGGLLGAVGAFLFGTRSATGVIAGLAVGSALGTFAHVLSSKGDTGSQISSVKASTQKVAEELKR